jgi:hypothetical protein
MAQFRFYFKKGGITILPSRPYCSPFVKRRGIERKSRIKRYKDIQIERKERED